MDADFKSKFKQLAVQEDKSLIEFTRRLARDDLFTPKKREFKDVFKI